MTYKFNYLPIFIFSRLIDFVPNKRYLTYLLNERTSQTKNDIIPIFCIFSSFFPHLFLLLYVCVCISPVPSPPLTIVPFFSNQTKKKHIQPGHRLVVVKCQHLIVPTTVQVTRIITINIIIIMIIRQILTIISVQVITNS